MRPGHFDTFAPVCPCCRKGGDAVRLEIFQVLAEQDGHILQGIILCPACGREYPILDGLPLLLADLRLYLSQALPVLMERSDVAPALMGLFFDAAGPGSVGEGIRRHLSSYGWDHYGEFDPDENQGGAGAVARCLERGLELLPYPAQGPCLDLGCGPGRSSFALAERVDGPVLGIDLSFPLIRLGAQVLRHGRVRYPCRRVGLVYDQRDFAVPLAGAERVDFWVCDLAVLPFDGPRFGLASALNLVDCLPVPAQAPAALAQVLRPDGQAILATPYDWSESVTLVENWLGGHSARGPHGGAAEPLLRQLLDGSTGLRLAAEDEDVPWQVRLHDRATMTYRAHLVTAVNGSPQ